MSTVTLDVQPLADALADFGQAWRTGQADAAPRISFASPELLWKVLSAKRWDILKAMAGQGKLGLREVARRVGRDVKGVHGDVHALVDVGMINRVDGGFEFRECPICCISEPLGH
jgi:predicted transcriptional regulator